MALAAASTPRVGPGERTSSCGGSAWVRGKLCMAVGRRTCPSRQSRKRSTSWSSSVSDYMSSTQAPSRLKQIDRRSCTGNVNSLKLGGLPAHPLRNTRSRPATRVWVCRGSDALQADVLTVPSRCAARVAFCWKRDKTIRVPAGIMEGTTGEAAGRVQSKSTLSACGDQLAAHTGAAYPLPTRVGRRRCSRGCCKFSGSSGTSERGSSSLSGSRPRLVLRPSSSSRSEAGTGCRTRAERRHAR